MMTTDRNMFIGGYTTPSVKDALDTEAERLKASDRRASRSRLIHQILLDALRRRGYQVEDERA